MSTSTSNEIWLCSFVCYGRILSTIRSLYLSLFKCSFKRLNRLLLQISIRFQIFREQWKIEFPLVCFVATTTTIQFNVCKHYKAEYLLLILNFLVFIILLFTLDNNISFCLLVRSFFHSFIHSLAQYIVTLLLSFRNGAE
jgi:hypothetical protein